MFTPANQDLVVQTSLRDGSEIWIRAIRPDDEERLRAGIAQLSAQSRYLRFFSASPMPPDRVIAHLLDADGHDHIAWGAILCDAPAAPAIGAVHAFRTAEDDHVAEFSVAVLDAWHGLGVGRLLTAVLLLSCRGHGLDALEAHVLQENAGALGLVGSLGGHEVGGDGPVAVFRLEIDAAIEGLRAEREFAGLARVFAAFD